ncbi:extracellular solute-binding protein [Phytohabitans kaempferiae]|uniref:Extracellular solute-binding protein n=1 Tax=Phytohabitans kaempferiae TaxID=1620943 RepID=A0ABV6M7Y6_9ACTN
MKLCAPRRRAGLALVVAGALAFGAGCTATGTPNTGDEPAPQVSDLSKHEGQVVVGGPGGAWGAALKAALDEVGAAANLRITYQEGTTSENMARLQAQRQSGRIEFDLVMTNDRTHTLGAGQGLWQPPNLEIMPNVAELDRTWSLPEAVFGNPPNGLRHVVISEGLGYNTETFAKNGWAPPTSLESLYDPKFASCAIPVNPSSGLSYLPILNKINSGDFAAIEPTLDKFKAVAGRFPTVAQTSSEALEFIQQGVGCIAPVSQARTLEQAAKGAKIAFVVPEGGSGFLSAGWGIPTGAPHPIAAHVALNALISAKASQSLLENGFVPNTNTKVTKPTSGVAAQLSVVGEYTRLGYTEIPPSTYDRLDEWSRAWDQVFTR